MVRTTIVLSMLAAVAGADTPAEWKSDRPVDGMKVEWREVKDSPFHEYRISTTSPLSLDALCGAVWGKDAKVAGDFKKRVIIKETETERLTYEQVKVPVVKDRDCIMHVQMLVPPSTGRCEVSFETREDPAYPVDPDYVRVPKVKGNWVLEPADGGTSIIYVVYSEPGGSVPALFARGGQRDAAIGFMKTILARAAK